MKEINIGSVISDGKKKHTITEKIGKGGFAIVNKAICEDRTYAVKVLDEDSDSGNSIYSFTNEFNVSSKASSTHAVKYCYLNEHGQYDLPIFIIMEFVDGCTMEDELANRQKEGNPFSPVELLNIFNQLIEGMIDISKVAVHRDIKPSNILVSNGTYKISDY